MPEKLKKKKSVFNFLTLVFVACATWLVLLSAQDRRAQGPFSSARHKEVSRRLARLFPQALAVCLGAHQRSSHEMGVAPSTG